MEGLDLELSLLSCSESRNIGVLRLGAFMCHDDLAEGLPFYYKRKPMNNYRCHIQIKDYFLTIDKAQRRTDLPTGCPRRTFLKVKEKTPRHNVSLWDIRRFFPQAKKGKGKIEGGNGKTKKLD
ncbi:hypothetical protein DV515_00013603 [Chloebia gouldiae]|uniref:Uncharacterized protein n=1 Tax=Chloebia gouldiae TaxID=44316 RepID=A0A3L8S0W6_CHLGU|nr:hypothetical protein DV515_00013603 [Chloebia gouldiae]